MGFISICCVIELSNSVLLDMSKVSKLYIKQQSGNQSDEISLLNLLLTIGSGMEGKSTYSIWKTV